MKVALVLVRHPYNLDFLKMVSLNLLLKCVLTDGRVLDLTILVNHIFQAVISWRVILLENFHFNSQGLPKMVVLD